MLNSESARARTAEDIRQFDLNAPLREAQTSREMQSAKHLENLNNIFAELMGAQAAPEGLAGTDPKRAYWARHLSGVPETQMSTVFNEQGVGTAKPSYEVQPGDVTHPSPTDTQTVPLEYWLNGRKMAPIITTKRDYDAKRAELEGTPGIEFAEPNSVKVANQVALYDALRTRKLEDSAARAQQAFTIRKIDVSKLPAELKQRFHLLDQMKTAKLAQIYNTVYNPEQANLLADAAIADYETKFESLIEQIPKGPVVPVSPQRRPTSQLDAEGPKLYPTAPPPQAGPAAAPGGVVPIKPSEDQIYQEIRALNSPDPAQDVQYLMTKYGMDQAAAISFLRKYFKGPGVPKK
jgi:hypothetical protein